jgi:hypothetical protein
MPTGTEELDVKVYIDYAQERINQKGPFIFCTDGVHIDPASKTNAFIDPVTLSVMGMPLPMTAEWSDKTTPTTGNYSRFQIYDFDFTGTGGAVWWNFNQYKKPGNSYIFSISDDPAIQSAPIELNREVIRNEPLFFSYSKLDKKSSDNQISFTLSWKNATNNDKDVELHFRSDGSCDVYRGYYPLSGDISTFASSAVVSGHNTKFLTELTVGTIIYDFYGRTLGQVAAIHSDVNLDLYTTANYVVTDLSYNKKVPRKIQNYSRTESNYNTSKPILPTLSPNDQFNDIYIIPCRGRDLLVLTSFGLNFCHTFDDLNVPNPPNNTSYLLPSETPIITPSGTFSIQILNGKIAFQLAKLYFLSKWTGFSQTITTPNPPPVLPTYFLSNTGMNEYIYWQKGSDTVTGFNTSFLTELFPGDRLLVYNQDFQTLFLGIVNTVTSNSSLELLNTTKFAVSDCVDTTDIDPGGGVTLATKFSSNRKLTGTLTFTLNSGVINGVGTLFTTELELGDYLYDEDGTLIGIVQAIISNTNLVLLRATNIARTAIPYYINLNQYDVIYRNAQFEKFGTANGDDTNNLNMEFIITDGVGNAQPFDGVNRSFKLKVKGVSDDADPLSSEDWGYMFYSCDVIYNLLNESTSNTPVDITTALTAFSLKRSENGDLTLNLSSRTKFLEDLGVVKPNILADRPIKVDLVPRPPALLTGLISFYGSTTVFGQSTLFTEELEVGDTLYLNDGTELGIILGIVDDTELELIANLVGGTLEYVEYTNQANSSPFTIFEGYLSSPEIEYILGENYNVYPQLNFSAICKKQHLNKVFFDTAPNFDNIKLPEIVTQSIIMGGAGLNDPNKIDLFATPTIESYQVPINRSNSNGQYNFGFNVGDSPGGFIERIRSDFANNFTFYYGHIYDKQALYQSSYESYMAFKLVDLNQILASSPPVVMYLNEQTANDNGGIPVYESYKRTIRRMSKTYEQPEANRVAIVGIDKANANRITVVLNDEASQYTGTLPVNRPDNWLGSVVPYVSGGEKFNSYQDVYQVADQLFKRITTGREIIEFESDLLTWFDSTSRIVTGPNLTGTLSANNNICLGVGTLFTTEVEEGDTLYNPATGERIGIVAQILNDTELYFLSNNVILVNNINFTKDVVYLNEFDLIDIGDTISISDLNNNIENYMILDWDFEIIKDNHISNEINVRRARYRAKKVTIPVSNAPVFEFTVTFNDNPQSAQPSSNQKIIAVDGELAFVVQTLGNPPFSTNTFSLTNEPLGMVYSVSPDTTFAVIFYVPTIGQANQVYENITMTCINSAGSTISYVFNVRTYDSL